MRLSSFPLARLVLLFLGALLLTLPARATTGLLFDGVDQVIVELSTQPDVTYTISGASPLSQAPTSVVGDGTPYVFHLRAEEVPSLVVTASTGDPVVPTFQPRSVAVRRAEGDGPLAVEASFDLRFWAPRALPSDGDQVSVPVHGERFFVRPRAPDPSSAPTTTTFAVRVSRTAEGELTLERNNENFESLPRVEGALVVWPAAGLETTTDSNGLAVFSGDLPTGRHRLEVRTGEEMLTTPVFVVPGYVQEQSPTFGRTAAIEAALAAALDHFGTLDHVLGAMLPTPLPRQAFFQTWAAAGGDLPPFEDPLRGFLSNPWIFVFTGHASSLSAHPVLLIAVESAAGRTRTFSVVYPGFRVGPLTAFTSLEDLADPDFNILRPIVDPPGFALPDLEAEAPAAIAASLAPPRVPASDEAPPRPGKVHALTINGTAETGVRYGVQRFLAALKPDFQDSLTVADGLNILALPEVGEDDPPPMTPLAALLAQIKARMADGDLLVVYFVAHGSLDVSDNRPPGGVVLDGGIFSDSGNKPTMTGFDIMRELRSLRPCRLWVIVESCYSGLILTSPLASTGYRPGTDLSMERAINLGYLDSQTEFLAMSSTDFKHAAKVYTNAVQNFFNYQYGGAFTNQLIATGWLANPFQLEAMFEGFQATLRSSGAGLEQNAQVLYRAAQDPCGTPPPPQPPPGVDDAEETATDMPAAAEEGRFVGEGEIYAEPDDLLDFWRLALPVGDYLATTDGEHALTVKTPGGKVRTATGRVPFRVPSSGDTFVAVGPGKTFRYVVAVEREENCFAGVRVRNQSNQTYGFRLYDSDGKLPTRMHLLAPGDSLEIVTSGPLQNFDLRDFYTLGSSSAIDQGFQIMIGCGRLQTFTFGEFSTSFEQTNLDL